MKKGKLPNLDRLASFDDLRPSMQYIEITSGAIATVTNGKLIARVDIDQYLAPSDREISFETILTEAGLEKIYIHYTAYELLKKATRYGSIHFDAANKAYIPATIGYSGSFNTLLRIERSLPDDYPNYRGVLDTHLKKVLASEGIKCIGFNHELLYAAIANVGLSPYDEVNYHFANENSGIIATASGFRGVIVIMPKLVTDKESSLLENKDLLTAANILPAATE